MLIRHQRRVLNVLYPLGLRFAILAFGLIRDAPAWWADVGVFVLADPRLEREALLMAIKMLTGFIWLAAECVLAGHVWILFEGVFVWAPEGGGVIVG
jgi:hypothetical protein